MLTILTVLAVLGVLFAAAVLSTREGPVMAEAVPDAADVPLPEGPLQPEDVGRLRFSLAARGYRMSEVDIALERLASELAERDARIAELEKRAAAPAPAPVQPAAPVPPPPPAPVEPPPAAAAVEPPSAPPVEAPAPVAAPAATHWSSAAAVPDFPVIEAPEAAPPPSIAEVPTELAPASPADATIAPLAAPADLPPADLGAELTQAETGSVAATSDVSPDTLLAALEETGEQPPRQA